MKTVAVEELKTEVSALLDALKPGETLEITKSGKIFAELKIVPQYENAREMLRKILESRAGLPTVTQAEWAEWKHEGHRY